ncbi:MAG: glycoside hydrolase family 57 protein [Planctomycetota bacterium]|jgi:alpha-amylase
MLNVVLYFQVHQPIRLSRYKVLDIGQSDRYFDDSLNKTIINKISEKCYLRCNRLLLDLIHKFAGRFRVAFSITGVFVEQLRKFRPDVLASFTELAKTGAVEFIGETYYHSLSFLYDEDEFLEQVRMHSRLMEDEFTYSPVTFRNTELIYSDRIAELIAQLPHFKTILTEGADKVLGWRSPLYVYKSHCQKQLLLLKYYSLSDDIAFRFSNKCWEQYPLTVERFVDWLEKLPLIEKDGRDLYVNLFMDYETFGEHQWEDTGIFDFIERLPGRALNNGFMRFIQPCEASDSLNYEPSPLLIPDAISWADSARDMSAWLSNSMQCSALATFYDILGKVKDCGRADLLEVARKLSTSDLYYYMCTKYFQDGDVHKYFSPYSRPEDAYIYFLNVLADLEKRIEEKVLV